MKKVKSRRLNKKGSEFSRCQLTVFKKDSDEAIEGDSDFEDEAFLFYNLQHQCESLEDKYWEFLRKYAFEISFHNPSVEVSNQMLEKLKGKVESDYMNIRGAWEAIEQVQRMRVIKQSVMELRSNANKYSAQDIIAKYEKIAAFLFSSIRVTAQLTKISQEDIFISGIRRTTKATNTNIEKSVEWKIKAVEEYLKLFEEFEKGEYQVKETKLVKNQAYKDIAIRMSSSISKEPEREKKAFAPSQSSVKNFLKTLNSKDKLLDYLKNRGQNV